MRTNTRNETQGCNMSRLTHGVKKLGSGDGNGGELKTRTQSTQLVLLGPTFGAFKFLVDTFGVIPTENFSGLWEC